MNARYHDPTAITTTTKWITFAAARRRNLAPGMFSHYHAQSHGSKDSLRNSWSTTQLAAHLSPSPSGNFFTVTSALSCLSTEEENGYYGLRILSLQQMLRVPHPS
jgi:hypothetical protein